MNESASTPATSTPGRCARDLYAVLETHSGDMAAARTEVIPLLAGLARRPDLLEIGLPRESNHGSGGSWLYWDGEIGLFTAHFPDGITVPVHDHGTWEIVGTYTGELDYQAYRRVDDGSVDGHAELEVVEDRVLRPGDFSVVPPPPDDIHGFRPRGGDMWMMGVLHGAFAEQRRYFDVENRTYVVRHQQAWRRSLDASSAGG
jgi:predicted metal-dependent enzyme (double-stranded beta helix superfamily)